MTAILKPIGQFLRCIKMKLDPFTPTSNQERISPHIINTTSSGNVMRTMKNTI